jgi:hypothetical protein
MSYSGEHRSRAQAISGITNALVAILSILLIPYFLLTGLFWRSVYQAPLAGVLVQLLCLSALPLASIIVSLRAARKLEHAEKTWKADAVRFAPLLTLFVIGPALAFAMKVGGMAILGR